MNEVVVSVCWARKASPIFGWFGGCREQRASVIVLSRYFRARVSANYGDKVTRGANYGDKVTRGHTVNPHVVLL
jgi:hypothetical protein